MSAILEQAGPSHAALLTLVEQAPDGVFLADSSGRYTYVNEAGRRMLGYSREEIVGKTILDFIPPQDADRLWASHEEMLDGRTHVAEWQLRRKDGRWASVEVSANILPDGQWQGFVRDISERKAHEAEREALLREANAERRWLQGVVDTLPLGVLLFRSGHPLSFNRRAEELFGMTLSPGGGTRQYAHRVLFPDGTPVPPDKLASSRVLSRGERVESEEYLLERPDGVRVPVLGSAAPIRDDAGRVVGGVGVFQELSERMRMEQTIRDNERLLRGIFELLPVGVWVADRTGRIVSNNPAGMRVWQGARYVGVPQFGEYKGWWLDSGKPIAAEEWALARALTRGETSTGELVRIQCFDGSFKTMINSAMPLRDETGAIAGAICVNEDITALHEAQEKLRESEHILRTVFDLLPVGLWLADREGRITLANPAGLRIWQGTRYVGPEQFHEYKAWWVESGKAIEPGEWALSRAVRNGETSRGELIRIQCFDGSFKTVINWAAPIRSATGEITGAIALNEDVTALQQTQEQLRAAVRDREELLAIVAHDLRNPLSGIVLMASAAERQAKKLPGGEPVREVAATLIDMSQRMSGLVDDLLAVAVAKSGRSMLKLAAVPAADLLARAASFARPMLARGSLALQVKTDADLPSLPVDGDRIVRVFANLLDNALKYTSEGGTITFAAEHASGGVKFSVANSGPALEPGELRAMFRPFWQARREDRGGAGLGLSICRSIVEAHGGSIWAEPAEGQRVRICFFLPRAPLPGVAALPDRRSPA